MDSPSEAVLRVLSSLDDPAIPINESKAFDSIREIVGPSAEGADRAELIAFAFRPPLGDPGRAYYQSLMSRVDNEGKEHSFPDRAEVTPEIIGYWLERSREVRHPVLRARYADLAWDLAQTTQGVKPDVTAARTAIDAYLEALDARFTPSGYEAGEKAGRALSIALQINDQDRVAQLKTAILDLDGSERDSAPPGQLGLACDLLLPKAEQVHLSTAEESAVIARQESLMKLEAERCQATDDANPAAVPDPFPVERVALRLAQYYRRKGQPEEVRRVLDVFVDAYSLAASRADALVGTVWLNRTQAVLRDFGHTAAAERVLALLQGLGKSVTEGMRTITTRVEIKDEDLDKVADAILKRPVGEQCARIGVYFQPSLSTLEGQVIELSERFPLQSLFPTMLIDDGGRPLATIGGITGDLEGRMVLQMGRNIALESPFLRHVLDRFWNEADIDALHQVFGECPLFDETHSSVIRLGLLAHRQGDWITSLHLLVPQIEHGLRNLVAGSESIYRPGKYGGLFLKNLDELLRSPAIERFLGSDFVGYAKVLLTDQRGLNVRHGIAHGTIGADQMTSTLADRVLHVLFLLVRVRQKTPSDA
jgi:hypothetical protein